ncbi:MAG: hypothetical protein QNJ74_19705 [Trichodesmium sp. MO_231.B1]|nr:hypothetical protein [Trichodesmium sp. MO_231.B1]
MQKTKRTSSIAFPFSFFSKPSQKSQRKERKDGGEWKEMSEEALESVSVAGSHLATGSIINLMNKSELIEAIATEADISKAAAGKSCCNS